MPIQLPITTYGMEVLHKPAKLVEKVDAGIIELIENMYYTMSNAAGVGLAAPQVNEGISVAIVDISVMDEYKKIKPVTMINPVIVEKLGSETKEEGCLSIPELRANVTRPDKIYLKFRDFNMNDVTLEAEGFLARVIQHEIDHLNGVLFVDHLDEDELKKYKTHLRKIKKGKVLTEYPLFV